MQKPLPPEPGTVATDLTDDAEALSLTLQHYVPYRLATLSEAVSQGLARHYDERFGIAIPEWRVLAALGEFTTMTAKAIGQHSRMHKTKVSRAVATLEERGLIKGEVSVSDRREIILSLTRDGRETYEKIVPVALSYQEKVLSGLSSDDLAVLERVIDAIFQQVDA